jgi:Invasion associated locus B (IalB) protein
MAFRGGCGYGGAMIAGRFVLVGALGISAALSAVWPAHAASHKKHGIAAAETAVPAATPLGTFDSWTAYEAEDKTGRVCYLAGTPRKSEPAGFARKAPMAMVTHRPAENIADVVSFVEGYRLKEGSDVTLEIGRSKFELFTDGDSAWARTSELDRTIVTTLAKSGQVVVKGTPQRGPTTIDVYSLAGFSKALAAIDKACGIKRGAEPHHRIEHHRRKHHARHAERHS